MKIHDSAFLILFERRMYRSWFFPVSCAGTKPIMKTDSFCIKDGKNFELSQVKCDDTLHYSESDQPAVEGEMHENILEIAELQDRLSAFGNSPQDRELRARISALGGNPEPGLDSLDRFAIKSLLVFASLGLALPLVMSHGEKGPAPF